MQNVEVVIRNFCIEGNIETVVPYGSGHINDTFRVINHNPGKPDYLLQLINHRVFKNIDALMGNIEHVIAYLKAKASLNNRLDPDKNVITTVRTLTDQSYYKDGAGNYWRMYVFLKDTKSYDLITTQKQAKEGGSAFGRFQTLLADMDASLLNETIPDFHNIEMRLDSFNRAFAEDKFGLAANLTSAYEFILSRAEEMCTIQRWGNASELPLRITHNDTKFNNILFDRYDEVQCIIDLDTVMPGYVAFDFGDAVRTIINTMAEDEKDLNKIDLNIPLFQSFAEGYLDEAIYFLTPKETSSLIKGVMLLPFMQGVRFLTDYLQGDVYFKTNTKYHNLERARAQFQLLLKLEAHKTLLEDIITEAVNQRQALIKIIK